MFKIRSVYSIIRQVKTQQQIMVDTMVETCVVMSKDVTSIGHLRYTRFRYTEQ